MKKDKIKVYILELLLIIILFFALFASNIFTRSILSVIMIVYMFIVQCNLKKKKINSIYKRQMMVLMLVFAMLYVGIFYLLGLHFGFVRSKVLLSVWSFFKFILPLTVIIVAAERMRKIFVAQDAKLNIRGKKIDLSLILAYLSMVLVDLVVYTELYDLTNLDDFLVALGFVLFASLSCNLLYNYISSRFGYKSIVAYRLITTLFVYIIPVMPDVYVFLRSFLRMLYPYLIYLVLEKTYSKTDFAVAYKDKKREIVGNSVLIVVMVLLIMLISCQFRYGILVIGSESMTGTINKGDAIIFEKYEGQEIKKGQIIIFDYNGIQTVHRVINIKNVNGTYRYYTQGDANASMDSNYVTDDGIYGLVHLRVKYIGYPTLWVRDIFS